MLKLSKLRIPFVILFMLVLSLSVFAETYSETGTEIGDYNLGLSTFNAENNDSSVHSLASLSNSQVQTPFVEDIDNDGVNEIYFFDGNVLRIYDGQTELIEGGLTLNFSVNDISTIISYDIDGDGLTEIILGSISSTNENIVIIEHNGTNTIIQNGFDYTSLDHINGDMMLKCRATQDCFMAFSNYRDNTGTGRVYGVWFNESGHGSATEFDNAGSSGYCKPKIATIGVGDLNGVGLDDYVFVFGEITSVAGRLTQIGIYQAIIAGTSVIEINDGTIHTSISATSLPATTDCDADDIRSYFTSPLIAELDSGDSYEEIVVAWLQEDVVGTSEFRMGIYGATGNLLNTYPKLIGVPTEAEGRIVSNIVQATIFSGDSGKDFCVMGYEGNDDEVDLLCGTQVGGTSSREFKFDTTGLGNISTGKNEWNSVIHVAQIDQDNPPASQSDTSTNPDEIISSFGVFRLSEVAFSFLSVIDSLDLIFTNPKLDSVFITADLQGDNFDDGLLLDSTNVWFLEDGFSNSVPVISSGDINPCLNSGSWKINTSVAVQVACTDVDGDSTGSLVTLYDGESFEILSNSTLGLNGATFTHNLVANYTTANSNLIISCYDEEHQASPSTTPYSFVVASTGLELDDCHTDLTPTDTDDAVADEDVGNSALTGSDGISTGVNEFADVFNLTPFLIWLVFAGAIAFSVFASVGQNSPIMALGVITILEIFWLIAGTKLGMLPVSIIVTIVVIVAIPIGIWVGKIATSSNS